MMVTVPLDRSGGVPGHVSLRVERKRATRPRRAPLLMLTGMPGEPILRSFAADSWFSITAASRLRDIIAMDLRGTGRSGALRCRSFERASMTRPAVAAESCAAELGPRRGFYTAEDSAQDVEAVRQALGIDKLALVGGSYGAQVALAYARRHPDRVERLVLDSPFGPEGFDALYRPGLAAVPQAIQVLCRKRRCQHASDDPLVDLAAVARRLARGPLPGRLVGPSGRSRPASFRAFDLFAALFAALEGHRAVMGYIHNAARGDLKPLLRLGTRPASLLPAALRGDSRAAYAASMCEEARLPWSRSTPLAKRAAQTTALVGSLDPATLSPLGPRAALESDVLELCRLWPMGSPSPEPVRPIPPLPALVVASVEDMLAPVSMARAVANMIPGARLLRLRGAGHDVFGSFGSSCAALIRERFLAGESPKDVCGPEHKSYRGAAKPPPLSLREVAPDPRVHGAAGRTLTAVNMTVRDGGAILQRDLLTRIYDLRLAPRPRWRRILLEPARAGALRRGSYAMGLARRRLVLRGASYVPGVRVSGSLLFAQEPLERRGVLRIAGPGGPNGTLIVRGGVMTGRLNGREVRAPTRWGPDLGFTIGR